MWWSSAIMCLAILTVSSALPASKLENPHMFMVQMNESNQTPEETKGQQQPDRQVRDFPWPYPPVFESALPADAKQRLVSIYLDPSLSTTEREDQTNAVFDSLPQEIIEKLPLPDEYERLPMDVYRRIEYIHVAPGWKWKERQTLIRDIVESLPEAERQLLVSPRLGGPPAGFEEVLAPTVYKQLLFVHHNTHLTKEQKADQITLIMKQVPQDQINRLPMPRGFDTLPVESQQRARSLIYDYSLPQPARALKVRRFVEELPPQIRSQLR